MILVQDFATLDAIVSRFKPRGYTAVMVDCG
jgi:hypothetical protein